MKTKQVLSMNDKMLKMILLVAIFATTQVTLMSAQTSSPAVSAPTFMYNSGAPMEVGDSVMIHKDSLRYLTGERMSTWVYGVPHQIRQLGTKTKPAGVLLRGIYSWIAQGSLIPLNQKKTQEYIDAMRAAEQAAIEAAAAAAAAEASMFEEYVEEVVEEVEEVVEDTLPPAPQPYEMDRFSVGVRGGLASLLPQSKSYLGASWGFDVLLDLQYAHYWSKGEDKLCLGVMTGVSVGYMNYSKTVMGIAEQSILGTGNDETKYDVLIEKVATVNHQLQLEVPLMFSMVTPGGLFLNAGPKFIMPVYTPYSQTLYNPMVIATDMQTGVEMVDNPVMGRIETIYNEKTESYEYASKGMNNYRFNLTFALGAEVGYELPLASGHSIGFGVYANCGLFSTYKYNGPAEQHIVSITPPNAQSVGIVEVNSVNNTRINGFGYLDAGLKVTYNINWKK